MSIEIPEPDWKIFRELHPIGLDRLCRQIPREIDKISADEAKSAHERYLEIFGTIDRRNKKIAALFIDYRRSTALFKIEVIYKAHLFTEEELARFSEETQSFVRLWLKGKFKSTRAAPGCLDG